MARVQHSRDPQASPDGAPAEEIRRRAREGVARWRDRAADPLAEPAIIGVFETAARSCGSIYTSV